MNIKNKTVKYGDLLVLDKFSHSFEAGKITSIFGPSGCGKTSLLNVICEEDIQVSYVFQEDKLMPWLSVEDNIKLVCQDDQAIKKALDIVKMSDYKAFYPKELSGGMKRRVALVRAFVHDGLLLMDEPFKGLDDDLKFEIIESFLDLHRQVPRTVIMVTHDEKVAKKVSHKILYVKGLPLEVTHEV
ncbi:ATP-binding cassette domain-containing protein [Acidaminobacter sp. JC074]|uniref:ATP-binding cassette domain-containing protein n=1 Tax=Acidaminobacter sp. JC074 TaxID=2530199 RepID=UPI001F0EFB5D|nr:ATP-binding cassette domain-containing protein [Acidaminobacter sp. JC074]MCH4886821.1 ATP-binding cassette domain-containing protein [Acidaminobacter sp. JC074]